MATLRKKLIRLAHANPELRPHLMPLLQQKQAGAAKLTVMAFSGNKPETFKVTFLFEVPTSSGRFTMQQDNFKHFMKEWKGILKKVVSIIGGRPFIEADLSVRGNGKELMFVSYDSTAVHDISREKLPMLSDAVKKAARGYKIVVNTEWL